MQKSIEIELPRDSIFWRKQIRDDPNLPHILAALRATAEKFPDVVIEYCERMKDRKAAGRTWQRVYGKKKRKRRSDT